MSVPNIRLVHLIAQLRFGAGRYVVDLAREQHRREPGRVAVVVCDDFEAPWASAESQLEELARAGVPVLRAGDFFHRHAAVIKDSAARIRGFVGDADGRWAPDAVAHAHTAMAAVAARWAGAPRVIATCHGWGQNRPAEIDLQDAIAFSGCDTVLSPSRLWADVVRECTGVAQVPVLPYGFDLSRYPELSALEAPHAPRVVCVGELTHRKGQDLLIGAMADVWTTRPDVELHLMGDGDARASLEALAREVDPAGGRIVFHGMVDGPYAKLREHDLFVLPTRSDNQPVAIVEALLAGLPVIGAAVGGVGEMIEEARAGLVVQPESPRHLAAAIHTLLDAGPAGRRELGACGERFARRRFDIVRHADRLESVYAGVPTVQDLPKPIAQQLRNGSAVRLHLGCGDDRREGWINVDTREQVAPDVVARAERLSMFPDDSVDLIEACHLFEHLPLHDAHRALAEWRRVLRHGGELVLELPNLDACLDLLKASDDPRAVELAMIGMYGWSRDIETVGDGMSHRWGWTPDTLGTTLRECGFGDVRLEPVTQTWRPAAALGRDFRIRAVKAVQ